MDAFFASVEQRDNPMLRGKPVAVGYPSRRGVVAAASYEARKFGVHSAMPSIIAQRKCPELIFVSPRFEVYRTISKEIREIFADYTPLIEPLSLDEAYLDVTKNPRRITSASAIATEIRERILKQTGLTASAGISYNKFLAKLASDYRKPNGQFVILPEQGREFIKKLEIKKFHGIGPTTAEKMRKLGIHTGMDLGNCSLEFLVQHFGKIGKWYHAISQGEDNRPVEPERSRKSYSLETTFEEDLSEFAEIEKRVALIAIEVWEWSESTKQRGRTVTLKIKFSNFKQITRSKSFSTPITEQSKFYNTIIELIRSVFPISIGVRLVGVTLANFCSRSKEATAQLEFNF